MYSYEERMKAVELYIKYDYSLATVIRELGYPNSRCSLLKWHKEFLATGELRQNFKRESKYSQEDKNKAIEYYLSHGKCISKTIKAMGYPNRYTLSKWLKQEIEDYKPRAIANSSKRVYTDEDKQEAVVNLIIRNQSVKDIADVYGVTSCTLYNWKSVLLGNEGGIEMRDYKSKLATNNKLSTDQIELSDEIEELQKEIHRLRLEKEVLEKAAKL